MKRENRRLFMLFIAICDAVMLMCALCLSYALRFYVLTGEPDHAPLSFYVNAGLIIIPFFLLLYGVFGLYDRHTWRNFQRVFERLVQSDAIGTILLLAFFFLVRKIDISRMVIAIFFITSTLLVALLRFVFRRVEQRSVASGMVIRRVLLVGSGDSAARFLESVTADSTLGVRVVGRISDNPDKLSPPILGSLRDLDEILAGADYDEVIAALAEGEMFAITRVISACEKNGSRLSMLPFYYEYFPSRPYVDELGGMPLINLRRIPLDNAANALLKRCFDIIGSAVLLVVTSPVMLIAAVGTLLSSPGPVFFKQERIGREKRPFIMYKLRTMRVNNAQNSAWTTDNDPRRTRFGAYLRKFSIDELPQLWNVLKGDMSLVGPRPEIPFFVDIFRVDVPMYMIKHQVRPGMTGWAQINGLRGNTSIPDRVKHDVWYIENWSILLDIRILLLTPFRGVVNSESLASDDKRSVSDEHKEEELCTTAKD